MCRNGQGPQVFAPHAVKLPRKFDCIAIRTTRFVKRFTSYGKDCNIRSSAAPPVRNG